MKIAFTNFPNVLADTNDLFEKTDQINIFKAIYTPSAITLSLMSLTDFIKIWSWYRGRINKNKTKGGIYDEKILFYFFKESLRI